MPDVTARVRAKGLDATGVTEAHAERMWVKANGGKPGDYGLAIVEYQTAEAHGPNIEGKKRVDLVLTLVEPAMDSKTEDALRELMRAMSSQRRTDAGELPLDGTAGSLEDARTGALAHIDRDEDGNPVGVWDGNMDSPIAAHPVKPAKAKATGKADATVTEPTAPKAGLSAVPDAGFSNG